MKGIFSFVLCLALIPMLYATEHAEIDMTHTKYDATLDRDVVISPVRPPAGFSDSVFVTSFAAPGANSRGCTFDGTDLWIADDLGTLYKVDAATGAIIGSWSAPGGGGACGLAWDGTHLWMSNYSSNTVYEIDPATVTVISQFTVPGSMMFDLAYDGANLYAAFGNAAYILGFTTTGVVIDSIHATYTSGNVRPFGLAYVPTGAGELWTSDGGYGSDMVNLWDFGTSNWFNQWSSAPATYPCGLAYDPVGGYMWVACWSTDMVYIWDVGAAGAPAFWDFETGWQGWTHTSGLTFPAAWAVVTTTYPGGPYWTYVPPPSAGDSAFIIDSDAAGSGTWVVDTAMSPAVANPGYLFCKWGFYLQFDDLEVLIREFTGSAWGSWGVVTSYSGTTGPQWDSVDVSAYTGDSIQVAFGYDDGNSWLYGATFDNVGFYLPPVSDVGTDAILEPVGVYSLNDVVTPQSQVRNFGDFEEVFPVVFTMTHNAIVVYSDTVDGMTLMPGEVDTAVFAPYTFGEAGTYDLVSYTDMFGDQNPDNDTAYATAVIFEWVEDFESSNGNFVPAPVTGAWEWGVPTSGPGAAHSGTQLWATILAGVYANNANWTLTSQDYYDATEDNPLISFFHWYDIEGYYDGGNVKYSTDNGTTWLLLHPVGGYDDLAYSGNAGIPAESCFCGISAGWEAEEFIIPVNAGQTVKLRFHFGTDASVTYPGWYIDDLAGLGLTYVGIAEEPGDGHIAIFGFAPSMSTIGRGNVSIAYTTTAPGHVSLKVYDATGRLVQTLVDRHQPIGEKSLVWNNKDINNRAVANGVYFLKLEAEGQVRTHKMIFVR
ncbi:immune inhibitor A [candidate division WOR-3 bacterium]|nr:immune inhibitor A [candidate division WOR-3 bacterium]